MALIGVWFSQAESYVEFSDGLEALKRDMFGPRPDKPVILHRSDILNRKGPFGVLKDAAKRRDFDDRLLRLVSESKFKMVAVVIDKKKHLATYSSPFHPYHYCAAAMLDRYAGWLNFYNTIGDVMAEARGREEDLQLKQAYRRVYESGTLQFGHSHHQRALTSKDIKLEPKKSNIAGLQLADILAHPLKQHCLGQRGLIDYGPTEFCKTLVSTAMPKFNRQVYQNRIDGYGRVYL